MEMTMTMTKHYFDISMDRCGCGGEWVYFDPEATYGCEVAGPFGAFPGNLEGTDKFGEPEFLPAVDWRGRAQCDECGSFDNDLMPEDGIQYFVCEDIDLCDC
jgi:hypothetical protein